MNTITLPHLTSSHIPVPHAFFTRQGGTSEGIYDSLNAGVGSGDNKAHVLENRRRLANFFGKPSDRLLTLYQIHSNICVTVNKVFSIEDRPQADALVTDRPGIILGILTADCVPVLLYDPKRQIIGAAHAGWKGALIGIVQATIRSMQGLGSHPSDIIAISGPSIAQLSYEVDNGFREQFLAQDQAWEQFFIASPAQPNTHFLFDNKGYVRAQIEASGVTQIETMMEDTYADEQRFYSFRRATHRGEEDYGRQLSAIMLPE